MTDILQLTDLLRIDPGPCWSQLRRAVSAHGFNPATTLLVECSEQGDLSEFGILVTRAGRVIHYVFSSDTESWTDGCLSEWNDISERWSSTPYQKQVKEGLKLAQQSYSNR